MTNLIGHSLGRYHILEQLGQGGMATVYKAYDTRLERDVAVKVLRTELFGQAVLERLQKRFEREAKALAKLSHPNIVEVYDYGEYEGQPYLVMKYLPGGTLKQRLGKPMPWSDALRLLLPVADALNYAHQHNILHRDVKPSNILLTENGQPMLTDFGIAKILDLEDGQTLTATGVGVGTPEYMSPEQGLGKPVDARTDVYSLGVVLYEMVTGRKPFQADTPMAVVFQHVSDPLPRPTQFAPDLPEAVEKILLKALAKQPADRYASMAEFAAAMEKAIVGQQPAAEARPQTADRRPPSDLPSAFIIPPSDDAATIDQAVTDEAATVDQGVTGETVLQEEERRPQTVDHPPSTVHRPPSKPWLPWLIGAGALACLALIGIAIGVSSYNNYQIQIAQATAQAQATATVQAYVNRPQISNQNASMLQQLQKIYAHSNWISGVTFSPDGSLLASSAWDHTVKVWLVRYGKVEELFTIQHDAQVEDVTFSPDGKILAFSGCNAPFGVDNPCKQGVINLYSVSDKRLLRTIEAHSSVVGDIAFSPDGQLLASASDDKLVQIWRVADGALLHTLKRHTASVKSVAFSPNGNILASGSSDKTVRLWQVADAKLLHTFQEHTVEVADVVFSPDGHLIAAVGGDNNPILVVWDVENSQVVYKRRDHQLSAGSAIFSVDGSLIITGGGHKDHVIQVRQTSDGYPLIALRGHEYWVADLAISPDGRLLVSGGGDGLLIVWGIP